MKQLIIIIFILMNIFVVAQSNKKTMQNNKVIIEIWSDIVCPFCFVGKKKIELAIAKLKAEDKVDIIWRSFQLDPEFSMDTSISTKEYLVKRKGYPIDQVNMMIANLEQQGKKYDIDFNFEIAHSFNTLNAHRLIQWAKKEEKSNELKEALMINFFSKGIDLSNTENLLTVVHEVGLVVKEAEQILESNAYKTEVKEDRFKAQQLGIRGVPYFIINGKEIISGAQDDKVFRNVLSDALKNIEPSDEVKRDATICIPNEGCE